MYCSGVSGLDNGFNYISLYYVIQFSREDKETMQFKRYNSRIIISDISDGDAWDLLKRLSLWDPALHRYSWTGGYHLKSTSTVYLPAGISDQFLVRHFGSVDITDLRHIGSDPYDPIELELKYPARDELQSDAIDFLLGKRRFRYKSNATQSMLNLRTGSGKTYCTIAAISELGLRALVIVDRLRILNQWREQFLKFTNIKDREIYSITGRESIERIDNKIVDRTKVFIASYRTIQSYMADDDITLTEQRFRELFERLRIGIKVYDEAHVEVRNQVFIDCFTNTDHSIYLTATPNRSNRDEDRLYRRLNAFIPRFGLDFRFADRYHTICYVDYNSRPDIKTQLSVSNRRGFDMNYFADYSFGFYYPNDSDRRDYDEELRNYFIGIILKLIGITINKYGKTAVILQKIEHIQILYDVIRKKYPGISIGRFCGLVKKSKDQELACKLILTTEKSLGKAVDVKDLQFVIVTIPFSSRVIAEQLLGRLRKIEGIPTVYFDLCDCGFDQCIAQRKSRRKVLDKKAIKIMRLKLDGFSRA